ncbi:MAG: DUF6799 domain-containing protein [Chitinophagaceae bacterium]
MKSIFMMAAALFLSVGVFAHGSSKKKHKTQKVVVDKEGFKKINGQMMVITNGVPELMIKAQTLTNGTWVLPNGAIKTSTGETMTMENGDYLDLEGNLRSKNKPVKKNDAEAGKAMQATMQ